MKGPNFAALAEMQTAVSLPMIASGGVCQTEHVRRLMESECLAASSAGHCTKEALICRHC